jgi:hypothetical protein
MSDPTMMGGLPSCAPDGASEDKLPENCSGCGIPFAFPAVRHLCDLTGLDNVWCDACFPATPCGRGEHEEGCATHVFDGRDEETAYASDPAAAAAIALAAEYRWSASDWLATDAGRASVLEDYGHQLIARLRAESLLPLPCPRAYSWCAMLGVLGERLRQVRAEGFDDAHDDEHDCGELARAAACYAFVASIGDDAKRARLAAFRDPLLLPEGRIIASLWPWDFRWWKPKTPLRDLERAGALILAEIERRARSSCAADAASEDEAAADDPAQEDGMGQGVAS